MDCKFYSTCQKEHSCPFLGECVFGHKMIVDNNNPQAICSLHYSTSPRATLNVLRSIKHMCGLNGFVGDAAKHLKKIRSKLNPARKQARNYAADVSLSVNDNTSKRSQPKDEVLYLQSQTVEQFRYKKYLDDHSV